MRIVKIIIGLSIAISVTITSYLILDYITKILQPSPIIISKGMPDKFGILSIYPTKQGGRECFIDMDNPKDGVFSPGSEIERQKDGSWLIGT